MYLDTFGMQKLISKLVTPQDKSLNIGNIMPKDKVGKNAFTKSSVQEYHDDKTCNAYQQRRARFTHMQTSGAQFTDKNPDISHERTRLATQRQTEQISEEQLDRQLRGLDSKSPFARGDREFKSYELDKQRKEKQYQNAIYVRGQIQQKSLSKTKQNIERQLPDSDTLDQANEEWGGFSSLQANSNNLQKRISNIKQQITKISKANPAQNGLNESHIQDFEEVAEVHKKRRTRALRNKTAINNSHDITDYKDTSDVLTFRPGDSSSNEYSDSTTVDSKHAKHRKMQRIDHVSQYGIQTPQRKFKHQRTGAPRVQQKVTEVPYTNQNNDLNSEKYHHTPYAGVRMGGTWKSVRKTKAYLAKLQSAQKAKIAPRYAMNGHRVRKFKVPKDAKSALNSSQIMPHTPSLNV